MPDVFVVWLNLDNECGENFVDGKVLKKNVKYFC